MVQDDEWFGNIRKILKSALCYVQLIISVYPTIPTMF